jgi:adenylate cyclase class 2
MSVEIEMKFPVADLRALEARLTGLNARPHGSAQTEVDQYFNAPDRDFAQTDEAFRLRQVGSKCLITYKGPKRDQQTKTRTEIEVPLGDGEQAGQACTRLFIHLGYRPVAIVRKRRRSFQMERGEFPVEICLDEVEGVGQYAEIEIVGTEESVERARKVVQDLALELGLNDSERRSYLELLLSARKGNEA